MFFAGIGTAVPSRRYTQKECWEALQAAEPFARLSNRSKGILKKVLLGDNGIATRHADTIDTKFFVDGEAHVVGLAHTAFVKFREKTGRDLTDREASFVAAEYLRERLEEDDVRPLYDVPESEVLRLINLIGIK